MPYIQPTLPVLVALQYFLESAFRAPVLFLAVIICMNQILILALKPCTNFRNDIHKLETNQYDDLFVGTSHGKAGINPEVVDKITGERSLNLCLGGEEVQDSYYIIKEACRVNKPKKIIYELDPKFRTKRCSGHPVSRI